MDNGENSDFDIPEDVLEEASVASEELLPQKSRKRYDREYEQFQKWCTEKDVKSHKEEVFLAYFSTISKTCQPSTLWSRYSMLKTVLKVQKSIDIGVFCKLTAYLKKKNVGYRPKKSKILTKEDFSRFINEAPDKTYLMMKVATIFGLAGACRREELMQITLDNIKDTKSLIVVTIPYTKTYASRTFVLSEEASDGKYMALYRKYAALRPENTSHRRFFVGYRLDKCTSMPVGINTFGKIPSEIAGFLGLSNPEQYTGHCFRRSSASHLADSGANLTTIKKHGGWKSSTVAEGYIENSIQQKRNTSNAILGAELMTPGPSTSTQNFSNVIPSSSAENLVSAIRLKQAKNCNFSINIVNNK